MGFCSLDRKNNTNDPQCFELQYFVVTCFLMLLSFVIVLCNSVVLVIAALNKDLRSSFFCLILNLALADMCVGLFDLPMYVIETVVGHWPKWLNLCHIIILCDTVAPLGSIYTQVAIAINRYHSLNSTPNDPKRCTRNQRNIVTLFIVWFSAVGVWISTGLDRRYAVQILGPTRCMAPPSSNVKYAVFISVVAYYLPTILIIYLNFVIFMYVRMLVVKKGSIDSNFPSAASTRPHNQDEETYVTAPSDSIPTTLSKTSVPSSMIHRMSLTLKRSLGLENSLVPEALWLAPITAMLSSAEKDSHAAAREMKVANALMAIIIMYSIWSIPSSITYTRHIASPSSSTYHILRFLTYVNSATNPFLYAFSSDDFQRALRVRMGRKKIPKRHMVAKFRKDGKISSEKNRPGDVNISHHKSQHSDTILTEIHKNSNWRPSVEHGVDPTELHNALHQQLPGNHTRTGPNTTPETVPQTPAPVAEITSREVHNDTKISS